MSEEGSVSTKDIWPQELDYISRPERYKYVRKIIKPDSCVFCTAKEKKISFESLCLYKNSLAMALLNKYPYNTGHMLILPTRHCGDLTELTDKEFLSVNELLRQATKILKDEYRCEGLNIGLNYGKVAGAGIPEHLHWHIIPRWLGDTNFFPLIAETKVHSETIEQSYNRLSYAFKELV